jgi:tetratricopeptide (TPR) repeat protein
LKAFTRFSGAAPSGNRYLPRSRERVMELREKVLTAKIKELTDSAKTAYRKKAWQKVLDLNERLYGLSPKQTDCLFYIGMALLELDKMKLGYRKLKDFVKIGASGRRMTEAKRKVRALERDYRENPRSTALVSDGLAAYEARNYEEARDIFTKALTIGPLNQDAYYDRGLANLEIGKKSLAANHFEAALEDFASVLIIDPGESLVYEGQALALFYLKQYEDALLAAEHAMSRMPDRWQSFNIAGLVHHTRRRYQDALKLFTNGLDLDPDRVTLYINRALTNEMLEKFAKARSDLKIAVEKRPTASQLNQIQVMMSRIINKEDD